MVDESANESVGIKESGLQKMDSSWRARALVIGAVVGALTGLGTAFLLTRRAEQSGKPLSISTGQGFKLGTLLVGLVQQVLHLGDS